MQRYQAVSQNEIEKLHETSLRILNEVGVVFTYAPAREILAKGGAKVDGQTVRFPRELVERALKTVPSSFILHARNPAKNVELNTTDSVFAGPYGAPFVTDIDNGRRYGSLEDYSKLAKLCHMMDNLDIQSHIYCEACDVDAEHRHLEMVFSSTKYNDKPVMGGVLGYQAGKQSIELAAIPHGGAQAIKNKPTVLALTGPITPLCYDDKMSGSVMAYAELGQPQLITSLAIAGATAPVTIPSAIAVQNAEVLAGIVLTQLVNPGVPVMYGASGSNADMRTMNLTIGSPEGALFSIINGQLTKFYNIPARVCCTLTDSKCADAQAGYESMMTALLSRMVGGNIVMHAAGIIESYNCVSFEKFIIDHEIIGMVKHIGKGVEINDETLAFDVIKEVGPQGTFISHEHTFENCRQFYMPSISDRDNYTNWSSQGSLTAEQRANAKWKQMLAEYVEPKLPADVERDMRKYIENNT